METRCESGRGVISSLHAAPCVSITPADGGLDPNNYGLLRGSPTPGSADLCFGVHSLEKTINRIATCGIAVEEGPVKRTGAVGPVALTYVCDPHGNLIEFSESQA